MHGNELLVIDHGNQFPGRAVAPYVTFPSWWRRFAFQLLTPRAMVTYLYLCTLFDPNAIAYPLKTQIMEDMGLKNRASLNDALAELEELGFIISGERQLPRQTKETRTVYQRTAPEFTLLTLLNLGKIDAQLFPLGPEMTRSSATTSNRAVETGLRNLLGEDSYGRYSEAFGPDEQRQTLIALLTTRIQSRRLAAR